MQSQSCYAVAVTSESTTLLMNYTAYYCEENVWHLCADPRLAAMDKRVVWVSSQLQICPLWCQRAATRIGAPVWWDYHVFLLAREANAVWQVWDLDSTLALPVNSSEYFDQTFKSLMLSEPVFRVMHSSYYLASFSSDRSHMKNTDGSWQSAPPDWPAITSDELTFADMLDMRCKAHGDLYRMDELRGFLALS